MRIRASAAAVVLAVLASACSSSGSSSAAPGTPPARASKDPSLGVRVLDAVVAERAAGPSGSGGVGAYSGSGTYYMVFETHEGDATARYRLEVTRTQWFRFQEGAHVRITLNNNILQDIRAIN